MNISKEKSYYISVLEKKKHRKKKWTSKYLNFFKKNKIVSISIILFFLCVNVNLILIAKFLKVLQYIK